MLLGALIFLVGMFVGGAFEYRYQRAISKAEPRAVCGCDHNYSMHDADGRCHMMLSRRDDEVGWHWVECTCQKYTGPEPLPEVFA